MGKKPGQLGHCKHIELPIEGTQVQLSAKDIVRVDLNLQKTQHFWLPGKKRVGHIYWERCYSTEQKDWLGQKESKSIGP